MSSEPIDDEQDAAMFSIFRPKVKQMTPEYDNTPTLMPVKEIKRKNELFTITQNDLDNPDLFYPISNCTRRGVCLLFNHHEFDHKTGQSKRDGTDMDADCIEKLFCALRYEVRRYLNATAEEFASAIKDVRCMDHSQHDSFICVILSHGTNGYIYSFDSPIYVDDIVAQFRGDVCPTLAGKPKLFFIQACRGCDFDKGAKKQMQSDDAGDKITYKLPVEADVLVANSTFPGYFAWRNSREGSWFIQELYKVLLRDLESPRHHDIVSLLTVVARKVACIYESNTGQLQSHGMKQMTSHSSTLTKLFFLTGPPH